MSIAPGERLEGLASPAKRRRNKDGSAVCCLQLAHSERHAGTGSPAVKVQGHPRLRARRPAGWKLNSCVLVCGSGLNAAAPRTSFSKVAASPSSPSGCAAQPSTCRARSLALGLLQPRGCRARPPRAREPRLVLGDAHRKRTEGPTPWQSSGATSSPANCARRRRSTGSFAATTTAGCASTAPRSPMRRVSARAVSPGPRRCRLVTAAVAWSPPLSGPAVCPSSPEVRA